jgi:hypothetical protein
LELLRAALGSPVPARYERMTMQCSFCGQGLEKIFGETEGRRCAACGAVWLDAKGAREFFGDYLLAATWAGDGPACPAGCGALRHGDASGIAVARCAQCGGVLLAREAVRKSAESLGGQAGVIGATLYVLSLPERVGRSALGTAAGFVKELASAVVPKGMKKSHFYGLTIEKMLRFVIEDVGGVAGAYGASPAGGAAASENFAVKKAVGNMIDLAGIAALHFSPIWGLAILSDCALGARTYFHQLVEELRDLGVVEKGAAIATVDDLLANLEHAAGTLADRMDTPPLSVKDLRASVDAVRDSLRAPHMRNLVNADAIARTWNEMQALADKEQRSLLGISTAVAMTVADKAKKAGLGLYGSVRAGVNLLDHTVLDYYKDGLRTIREKGYWRTVSEVYAPYTEAVRAAFKPTRRTFTERLFSGEFLKRLWRRLFARRRA